MKWVGLFILMAAIVPVGDWLRRNPRQVPLAWMLVGFLPFVTESFHLYMAGIAWTGWPSYVRGAEFSVLDALVMALYLSLPNAQHHRLPFRLAMGLYFLAVLFSTFQASVPEVALFYLCQLVRMFLVYAVVSKASSTDSRVVLAILQGFAAGLIMEAGIASWQRFGLGVFQTTGNFIHQNFLGMMSLFVIAPFFALLLAGRGGRLAVATTVAGCVVEVLTVSRGTVGLAGLGYAAVFVLSAKKRWTTRKALVLLAGVAAIAIVTPLVLGSIEQRGKEEVDDSDAARVVLNTEAATMLADHPFGVGPNQYVMAAREGHYRLPSRDWEVIVHNVYFLVAVETGYFGLVTFVIVLIRPVFVAFACGLRNQRDERSELLLGFGVALLSVYIQSAVEWIFLDFAPQYMFALQLGMVAGLAQQLGYWRRYPIQSVSRTVTSRHLRS